MENDEKNVEYLFGHVIVLPEPMVPILDDPSYVPPLYQRLGISQYRYEQVKDLLGIWACLFVLALLYSN